MEILWMVWAQLSLEACDFSTLSLSTWLYNSLPATCRKDSEGGMDPRLGFCLGG